MEIGCCFPSAERTLRSSRICLLYATTSARTISPYRIHTYQPGWYAAWNEIDPGTLEDLHTQYSLQRVARFHAFDDEDRNVLILYRLTPLPPDKQHYQRAMEEQANARK